MSDIIAKIEGAKHNATSERLVEALCRKTQNTDSHSFRVLAGYAFSKVASMMRAHLKTADRGNIPINLYAINLAPSGHGKGHSTNIVEEQVLKDFRETFLQDTFPHVSEQSLHNMAVKEAVSNNEVTDDVLKRLQRDFNALGPMPFSFDSGSTPAIKQCRQKLLMSRIGSLNMEIDEIGSNLLANAEALNTFLELYDIGKTKIKLIKHSNDNARTEDLDGRTPANMMLYGTPTKLFDGQKTEEAVMSFFDTGYGRRCFFSYISKVHKSSQITAAERFKRLTDTGSDQAIVDISNKIAACAQVASYNFTIVVPEAVSILLMDYQIYCEKRADLYNDHDDLRKSEMCHRYFKALKLAGAYAFVDRQPVLTEETLLSAILVAEDSGQSYHAMLSRERDHEKLAKYIASSDAELTQVDLMDDLPFYKGAESRRREILNHAITYGYKNNLIIKRRFVDGIEFISGESIQETDLESMIVSYSFDISYQYLSQRIKFTDVERLTQTANCHFTTHALVDGAQGQGNRHTANVISGTNLLVLDVDGETTIKNARALLDDYKYVMYVTKRHGQDGKDRFRIILPMSHEVHLDEEEYAEFTQNIYDWLPFHCDTQTNQRSRKWACYKGGAIQHDGKLVDILPFIPRTSKNEQRQKQMLDHRSLSNLERWFLNNTAAGNRSNQLIKYAYVLADNGHTLDQVTQQVRHLNDQLPNPLPDQELEVTILRSAAKRITV